MESSSMEEIIYIDTNIFIDLLDSTRPAAVESLSTIREALAEQKLLCINSDTVTNAFYILSKTKRYALEDLFVLFEKVVSLFHVVAVENNEIMEALHLCQEKKYSDYEDTLQYICAKKVQADMILTNDKGFISVDIPLKGTQHS
jgi:predicted nucleic acid-binding protein